MTNFKKQTFSVLAAGAMLLNVAAPAFAGTEIVISGNGAGSDNWTTVNQTSTTTVTQDNVANVTNTVSADAKTGGNDANYNTGGDVAVVTGNADVDVNIDNALNSNSADVNCCAGGDTNVTISGNGADSENGVTLDQLNRTIVDQDNTARVTNNVDADAKTGYNDANSNTGGDVTIVTGKAKVDVNVATSANVNVAKVGNSLGSSNPSASFVIIGNGAGSDNYITAVLKKLTRVTQDNDARVTNNVDADAKTGGNDANFNTGGDVVIGTGNATVMADVYNAVNFNVADIDCGCTWDVLAKIAGNGAEEDNGHGWKNWWSWNKPDNIITLTLDSAQTLAQGNLATLTNNLDDLDAKTGYNDAELNTGDPGSDPGIVTGNATVNAGVTNTGNSNVAGDVSPFDLPDFPSNFEFSFSFASMMAFFGMSF